MTGGKKGQQLVVQKENCLFHFLVYTVALRETHLPPHFFFCFHRSIYKARKVLILFLLKRSVRPFFVFWRKSIPGEEEASRKEEKKNTQRHTSQTHEKEIIKFDKKMRKEMRKKSENNREMVKGSERAPSLDGISIDPTIEESVETLSALSPRSSCCRSLSRELSQNCVSFDVLLQPPRRSVLTLIGIDPASLSCSYSH